MIIESHSQLIYIQKRVKISQIQRENVVDLLEATKKYCKAVYEGAELEIRENHNRIQSLQQSISEITANIQYRKKLKGLIY